VIKIIPNSKRGRTRIGWLNSFHSFSFGNFFNKEMINFGPLRVINEDFVAPSGGFGKHPHDNMEIITYVIKGSLQHKDSMGNSSIIQAGEFQKMTAGKGVYHSEFNNSNNEEVHLFQIWIIPYIPDLEPAYEQYFFNSNERLNNFQLVATGEKQNGKIFIHQDVNLFLADLFEEKKLTYELKNGRGLYLHLVNGNVSVNNNSLQEGDAISVIQEDKIEIIANSKSQIMLFDLNVNFNK